jgi:hypothetical protein
MKINAFLISPGLEHQDNFRDAMNLIEKSGIDLSVGEVMNYSYNSNSMDFASLFPLEFFLKRNRNKAQFLKEQFNIEQPHAKHYDIVIVMGGIDHKTLIHLIRCLQARAFSKLLILDKDVTQDSLRSMIPDHVIFRDETGKAVDSISSRAGIFH